MAYNHFDYVPSTIDRKRSVFKYDKACASSAFIGFLYPICKPERMMPGSTLSLDIAAEIRSGALVAPLMDEIICDFFSFFVPNRIVWEHWKQFVGAVDDVLFNNLTQYSIPSFKFGTHTGGFVPGQETFEWNQLIACHFGLPYPTDAASTLANCPTINALPFRGYTFIWNEFFRPEQIVPPEVFNKTDTGWIGMNMDYQTTLEYFGTTVYLPIPKPYTAVSQSEAISGGAILPVYRVHRSLWTSCLPAPSLETLNLLANLQAPVGVVASAAGTVSSANLGAYNNAGTYANGQFVPFIAGGTLTGVSGNAYSADLSQALLTVNNYRETIMLQNYYDVLNRAGSRYDEIMYNIFGSRTGNAVTDIPELITHKRFTIYRKEVVATANSLDSQSNTEPIGSQAAYIDTVIKDNFFTRSTTEHGYIHMMYAIRPARIRRVQGIEPEWQQLGKMDLYYPQFDGMGDVARYGCELFWDYTSSEASQTGAGTEYGYQEYGAEWKYQRNDATGFLDHNCPTKILGYSLQEDLATAPALTGYYLSCVGECKSFSDCLALPNATLAPQFIVDIRLNGTITHPMPVYNIPGSGALL